MQQETAHRDDLSTAEKVRRILKAPPLVAHECSRQYPDARQMISNIYAHFPKKWNALRVDGLAVLRGALEAGRCKAGFYFGGTADLETQADAVIDLGLCGLADSAHLMSPS